MKFRRKHMRTSALITSIILVLATIAAGLAYYGNYPMYSYGQGYTYYGGGAFGAYSQVDGYHLTSPGPMAYPPNARYVNEPSFRGHYSGYTGQYYDIQTGRQMTQYRPYYGGVPARYYPQLNVVHYE